MPGYATRELDVRVGSRQWKIRSLSDNQQYADPRGDAKRAGICSASWSLFGQLWPASLVLAHGANVTASDRHPLSEPFLDHNAVLNDLPLLPFLDLAWEPTSADEDLGRFDLIIGSDILYERHHPALVAAVINRLAGATAKMLITCPGRSHRNRFSRLLRASGFELTQTTLAFTKGEAPPYRGRLLCYRRAV